MIESDQNRLNHKLQWIVGGIVFLFSLIVYMRTVAPTQSFWDCGEFITCSYQLGVMHPPGAPLYVLIGRLLTLLPFFKDIGLRVNVFSAFVSAATVLLTFFIIVQLVRRWRGEARSLEDRIVLFASGGLGALTLAFLDSFWFNALEAEVYAFSMFFTALVIWLSLLWEDHSKKSSSLLLVFFIFYLFGLAAGVHLLNILAFPFVLLVAYFHDNTTVRRLLLLLFLQAAVPVTLYVVLFQFNPAGMTYQSLTDQQTKAWNFLQWFGSIWVLGSLIVAFIKDRLVFKSWFVVMGLLVLGYSTYMAIYLRAGLDPPINMNDPSNLEGIKYYLGRKQYGHTSQLLTFLYRQADFWQYQIQLMYTRYFGWNFIGRGELLDAVNRIQEIISFKGLWGIPFLVGMWGAVHHFFRDWKRAVAVLILFFLTGYAIVLYVNQPDPQPRERDYSYVGSFFAFALWIGIGIAGILESIQDLIANRIRLRRILLVVVSVILMIVIPVNLLSFNYKNHDRSRNYVARNYAYNILMSCAPNALLITGGDNDTYPIWYLQQVEGIRTDVRMVCLPLLNTPWFIKQLRDWEPRVPMALDDTAIERLQLMRWEARQVRIDVPESIQKAEQENLAGRKKTTRTPQLADSITFTLKPTYPANNPRFLRIQDLMIVRILQANRWERPVYFAATVGFTDRIGLRPFLENQGLALRVRPYRVVEPDADLLEENALNRYQYRGLNDPKANLNVDTIRMLSNFRSPFFSLARYYIMTGQPEEANRILTAMNARISPDVVPYFDQQIAFQYSVLFEKAGNPDNAKDAMNHILPGKQHRKANPLYKARHLRDQWQDWENAESYFKEYLGVYPENMDVQMELYQVYQMNQQYDKAITLLEEWQLRYPEDKNVQSEIERLKQRLRSSSQK